jgi:hypothetical protein
MLPQPACSSSAWKLPRFEATVRTVEVSGFPQRNQASKLKTKTSSAHQTRCQNGSLWLGFARRRRWSRRSPSPQVPFRRAFARNRCAKGWPLGSFPQRSCWLDQRPRSPADPARRRPTRHLPAQSQQRISTPARLFLNASQSSDRDLVAESVVGDGNGPCLCSVSKNVMASLHAT